MTLETTLAKLKAADFAPLVWKGPVAAKPGVLEHWVQRLTLDLGGMHHLIERYWQRVLFHVSEAYESYLRHGPLDRPAIRPAQPQDFVVHVQDSVNFHSCELRLRGFLLALMPASVKALARRAQPTSCSRHSLTPAPEQGRTRNTPSTQ